MSNRLMEREERPVRVRTAHSAFEGTISISPDIRTLDQLNIASDKFLRIHTPESCLPDCGFDVGTIGVNKEFIFFITEVKDCHPTTDQRHERSHFLRKAIRLRLGEFDIQGFLHVRGLRDPMIWFSQTRQPFVALTSASVVGPGTEFASSFVAVNPRHVLAVQAIGQVDETADAADEPSETVLQY